MAAAVAAAAGGRAGRLHIGSTSAPYQEGADGQLAVHNGLDPAGSISSWDWSKNEGGGSFQSAAPSPSLTALYRLYSAIVEAYLMHAVQKCPLFLRAAAHERHFQQCVAH